MAKDRTENSRFPDGFRILQGTREYITYIEHSSVRVWASDVAAHYDNHMHSAVEIIVPHRGTSVYRTADNIYRVQPGEVLILPANCPHELTESEDTMRYLLLFEPDPLFNYRDMSGIREAMDRPIYLRQDNECATQANDLLMQVVNCYFHKDPLWNAECYSYLLKLYVLLGREYLKLSQPEKISRHTIDPVIMNSAMTYINQHYREDIALKDVAAFIGYSRCYFSRMFHGFAGTSFTDYLTGKRLSRATELLLHTDKNVREVARDAGFGSVGSFNRIFREKKNCSPTRYRAIYSDEIYRPASVPDAGEETKEETAG